MSLCDKCFVTDKEQICVACRDNPIYKDIPRTSYFQSYPTTCKYGYIDCVYDPGYIWKFSPEWYKELYGDKHYSEVESCEYCEDGSRYDDEDK